MTTVITEKEIEALPEGSVLLDRDGDAWQRMHHGWDCVVRASNSTAQPSSSIALVLSPATILHTPDETADPEPDGAPMHAWEVTEGWQPRRENLHDEHNAERWGK